jgi:carbonic anhydrase
MIRIPAFVAMAWLLAAWQPAMAETPVWPGGHDPAGHRPGARRGDAAPAAHGHDEATAAAAGHAVDVHDAGHGASGHAEPAHAEPAHAGDAHATGGHAAPAQAPAAHAAPVHGAPAHAAPAHGAPTHSAPAHGHAEGVAADDALGRLLEGNARFVTSGAGHPRQDAERRELLAGGQAPFAIIVSCSDSRVPPEVVFDQGLGDLFVIRVAGNVVDDLELASIEYAAEHLGTKLVMILGHERCGAVTAAVQGGHLPGHLPALMEALRPAVDARREAHGDPVEGAMLANVELTAARVRGSEPILAGLAAAGELKVVGARYDLDTGVVEVIDPAPRHAGLDAHEALALLAEGNRRFVAADPAHPHQGEAHRVRLASGQAPLAIVLCCADSRVPPEILFDQGLGDLFVVRVAGNVADDRHVASIEYAAEHLGTRLIVVLGHERCGAVTAAVKGGQLPGHLPALMDALRPAVAAARPVRGDLVEGAIIANVELTAEQLRASRPILAELVDRGELLVVGARYDLDTGLVEFLDEPAAAPLHASRSGGHGAH